MNKSFRITLTDAFSFVILGILLFLAWNFATERLYGDSAFYLFKILNYHTFNIEHHRPVSYLSEFIPVLMSKSGYSINDIILAYSLNEWLLVFTGYLVIRYLMNDTFNAFLMLCTLVAGVKWNLFNPVSELILSTPFFFMLISLLNKGLTTSRLIISALLSLFLAFNHPLNALVLICILIIYFLSMQNKGKKDLVFLILTIISIFIAYKFQDPYDRQAAGNHSLKMILKNFKHFTFGRYFRDLIFNKFGMLLFTGLGVYFTLKEKKDIRKLIFLCAFFLGYQLLIIGFYGNLFPDSYEPFERYLYPLILVVVIYLSKLEFKKSILTLIFFVLLMHLGKTVDYGLKVRKRYELVDCGISNARKFGSQKVCYRAENFHTYENSGHDWILVNESMILSARNKPDSLEQIMVLEAMDQEGVRTTRDDDFYYFPNWKTNIKEADKNYFPFKTEPLVYANTDMVQENEPDSFFSAIKVSIPIEKELSKNKRLLINGIIRNNNNLRIHSGCKKENIKLIFAWRKNEKIIDQNENFLMCDVLPHSEIKQIFEIRTPSVKGDYELEILLKAGSKTKDIGTINQIKIN